MPEKEIYKKISVFSIGLLVLTSINPAGAAIFGESASPYLTEEDIAFNMQQLIATEEGFLVKNLGAEGESVKIERLDFVEHKVQGGESIVTIAELYGVKPESIVWENNIVNVDDIGPGQMLRIPPTDGISHEVKKGENVSLLAQKYEADISEIMRYNGLTGANLKVGQKLFIPGGTRITTSIIADNQGEAPDQTAKIANLETDINANIPPKGVPPVTKQAPRTQDVIPTPNVAPIQGLSGSKSISQGAGATIKTTQPTITEGSQDIPTEAAPNTGGVWGMPTIGKVTQGYLRGHYALDIANREKPAIWATDGGTVELAQWNGGAYGNYIIVDHGNGYKTLYAHAEELYVKTGDNVVKGQVIAKMGRTGRVYGATGIHLHYECHKDGVRINPYGCMAS